MVDISREEDRKALFGTVTAVALLLIFLIVLGLMNGCSDIQAEELDAGGVAVSLGNPDDGGPDNSAAQQQEEEYTPPLEEEYIPEHQETSDVSEAPVVKKTEPVKKPPTKTTPKKTTKPAEKKTEEPTKKVDERSLFPGSKKGNDNTGKGKGGTGHGGYKGRPDGTPDGDPNGNGGKGTQGDGPSLGTGISGGIGGFKVSKIAQPQGGVQAAGVIRLKVCVDASGKVIPSSIKWVPDRNPATSTNSQLRQRATAALKKFQFTNVSGSSGGCGYINFTFKLQ